MALSETSICNMALAKLGAKRINNIDTDSTTEAIHCRTHYAQTRDALTRLLAPAFASDRDTLSQDTVDPDFEWDNQFILSADFLRKLSVYGDTGADLSKTRYSYAIEGERLLTNEGAIYLRYVKRVTDTSKFDPLFVEVLVLQLALKLSGPLSGGNAKLQEIIKQELGAVMSLARVVDKSETKTKGRLDLNTWNDARVGASGRIDSQMGS